MILLLIYNRRVQHSRKIRKIKLEIEARLDARIFMNSAQVSKDPLSHRSDFMLIIQHILEYNTRT